MTTISSVNSSYFSHSVPSSTGASALRHQINVLQAKCADWNACPTTPPPEKQKQIAMLSGQIKSLQVTLEKAQDTSSIQAPKREVDASKSIANENVEANKIANDVIVRHKNGNNPLIGERIGGNINLSV